MNTKKIKGRDGIKNIKIKKSSSAPSLHLELWDLIIIPMKNLFKTSFKILYATQLNWSSRGLGNIPNFGHKLGTCQLSMLSVPEMCSSREKNLPESVSIFLHPDTKWWMGRIISNNPKWRKKSVEEELNVFHLGLTLPFCCTHTSASSCFGLLLPYGLVGIKNSCNWELCQNLESAMMYGLVYMHHLNYACI